MNTKLKAQSGHGVVVAYSGVHQAFQLALAADETNVLDCFLCSLYAEGNTWGNRLKSVVGSDTLASRSVAGFHGAVREYPWPLLSHVVKSKLGWQRLSDWHKTNYLFDRWAAMQLKRFRSQLFIGTETCALQCFKAGRELGMRLFLDCPQLHPAFLEPVLAQAADKCELPHSPSIDTGAMSEQKAVEYAMADRLMLYSEVHQRSFLKAGFDAQRFFQCPLWVDSTKWFSSSDRTPHSGPLRVLFVGSIDLRKGIPFLLKAIENAKQIKLTLVGHVAPTLQDLLADHSGNIEILPPQTKHELRKTYERHDILVLPSLGDSFGFVGLEAMACGLPVVVSENCGVPVPEETWRVPIMSSDAILERLTAYCQDRELLQHHSRMAVEHSRKFTPEAYRKSVASLMKSVLQPSDC